MQGQKKNNSGLILEIKMTHFLSLNLSLHNFLWGNGGGGGYRLHDRKGILILFRSQGDLDFYNR